MNKYLNFDADDRVYQMLMECDDTIMPLPDIALEPHLLISKVRRHYFEYIVKLLSVNYESNQKLLGKNIYLPSAIWRCAKYMEMKATQACMLVELYRQHIVAGIQELKAATQHGKLYRKLFEYLQTPPLNEKKIQVNLGHNSNASIKRRKVSTSPACRKNVEDIAKIILPSRKNIHQEHYTIPVVVNSCPQPIQVVPRPVDAIFDSRAQQKEVKLNQEPPDIIPVKAIPVTEVNALSPVKITANPGSRLSVESQDSEDQLMMQLEEMFRGDSNKLDDDLFERTLCDNADFSGSNLDILHDNNNAPSKDLKLQNSEASVVQDQHLEKIKSLGDRIAQLEFAGVLSNATPIKSESKWLCELYFQRLQLVEKLNEVQEKSRKKHMRIKQKFIELFGDDSDDEQPMSPIDESKEFTTSCKERIRPWVLKLLSQYYTKGRITSKDVFKNLARHLLKTIIENNPYPDEYEVHIFVTKFVNRRQVIRCVADFT